jgi:hypothetical protein
MMQKFRISSGGVNVVRCWTEWVRAASGTGQAILFNTGGGQL